MLLCVWSGAFVLLLSLAGCDYYSPNLGVVPTQSSTVYQLNPSSAPAGASSPLTLTVMGDGFVNGSAVLWNNSARDTTYVSTTELTAIINPSDLSTPQTVSVGVLSPGKTNTTTAGNNLSNFLPFVVTASSNPPPTISQLTPPSLQAGSGAFTLTVSGTGFVSGATGSSVLWNNQSLATTFVSSTQLTAQVPATDIATVPAQQPQVTVFNPAPGGGTSNSATFTISSAQSSVARAAAARPSGVLVGSPNSAPVASGPRFVAFVAASSGAAGSAAVEEVFLLDTCQGAAGCLPQTTLISVPISGAASDGDSALPSLSSDGRFVAFVSKATNLVSNDANGLADVFLRDTCFGATSACTPSTIRLSVGPDGLEANGPSSSVSISPDERYVVFDSTATNLVVDSFWGLAPSSSASFLRDTCIGAPTGCIPSTTRVTRSPQPAR